MKTLKTLLTTLLIMMPSISFAESPCTVQSVKFESWDSHAQQIAKVINALKSEPLISAITGRYEICFADPSVKMLEIKNEDIRGGFDGTFSLDTSSLDTSIPIDVIGLKLKRSDDLLLGNKPFLSIPTVANVVIALKDLELSNVINGIDISGFGTVTIVSSTVGASIVSGDSAKSGACVSIKSSAAKLDGVKVDSCATGILVGAPNVKITNSEISDNGTGVKIASGILGTELLTDKIFDNVEGIVFADGQPNELVFFDGDEQSFAPAEA